MSIRTYFPGWRRSRSARWRSYTLRPALAISGIEGHDSDSTELAVVTSMSLWRYTRRCRFGQAVAQPADACCRVVIEVDVEGVTAEVFRGYAGALTEIFDRTSRE